MYFRGGEFCGVKTRTSGDVAPTTRNMADPIEAAVHEERRRRHRLRRLRFGYLLALAWVVVGFILYADEVVKLVLGRA
jgi:hypothetical protein